MEIYKKLRKFFSFSFARFSIIFINFAPSTCLNQNKEGNQHAEAKGGNDYIFLRKRLPALC